MPEQEIGVVSHYFGHLGVAGVDLAGALAVGDTIHVKGHTSDFICTVDSMQIDNNPVDHAGAGDSIGIRVPDHAREHDKVYKIRSR